MCRMWGIHDSTKFTIEMVPLMDAAINGYVMDWANILSDKLATTILEYRTNARKLPGPFPLSITVCILWILFALILNIQYSDGDGLPKTLSQSIFIINSYGRLTKKIICIKFSMVLCCLCIILFSISLPLGFLRKQGLN